MLVLEKDGSLSAMCGNGIRAVAKYLLDTVESITVGSTVTIEILTGTISVDILSQSDFRVAMGNILSIDANKANFLELNILLNSNDDFKKISHKLQNAKLFSSAGEPHVVLEAVMNDDEIEKLFYEIQNSAYFPDGVNLNVIEKLNNTQVKNLTFERGVNAFTQSCGTGSTSVSEYIFQKYRLNKVNVINRGGELKFSRDIDGDFICTGPANKLPKDYLK